MSRPVWVVRTFCARILLPRTVWSDESAVLVVTAPLVATSALIVRSSNSSSSTPPEIRIAGTASGHWYRLSRWGPSSGPNRHRRQRRRRMLHRSFRTMRRERLRPCQQWMRRIPPLLAMERGIDCCRKALPRMTTTTSSIGPLRAPMTWWTEQLERRIHSAHQSRPAAESQNRTPSPSWRLTQKSRQMPVAPIRLSAKRRIGITLLLEWIPLWALPRTPSPQPRVSRRRKKKRKKKP